MENEQHLAENNSKISQAQLNLKYQELRLSCVRNCFDLQAKSPGFVANSTQKLMQIVPTDNYIAEAFVTNKDIGFVREGMKVDVRIDTFPYSEFGDIKEKLFRLVQMHYHPIKHTSIIVFQQKSIWINNH